jgi:putative FmdB family regulatory protein
MPIYEYSCASCGHTLDALQKLSDKPLKKCPECSRRTLKRLMSAPAFRLKGSGWYETDFKSDKESKRNLAESKVDQPPADAKSDAKNESTASGKETKATDTKSGDATKTKSKEAKPKKDGAAKSAGTEAA